MKKHSDFNLLMLEDKSINQTQFISPQLKDDNYQSNQELVYLNKPQISPNVAGELLMI